MLTTKQVAALKKNHKIAWLRGMATAKQGGSDFPFGYEFGSPAFEAFGIGYSEYKGAK